MLRAVLGGSFDPVHRGHIAMVEAVLDAGLAEIIHVIPAWLSPFKKHTSVSAGDRLEMVRLAFEKRPSIRVETMEIQRESISYSYDSLLELHKRFPDDALLLIIGADNVPALHRWHQIKKLSEFVNLIVLGRDNEPITKSGLEKAGFSNSKVSSLPDFDYPVSSTNVRAHLEAGQFPHGELPALVEEYIKSHSLYQQS